MARKIPKEFVPFDFTLPDRAQTRRAGLDGELLYYRSIMWCKRNAWTNGFIPEAELESVGKRFPEARRAKAAGLLVAVEYWICDEQDGEPGWRIPSWLAWNPSRDEMDEAHAARVLGAIKSHHKRGLHADQPDPCCPSCAAGQGAVLKLQQVR